jgi:hypothetical protein
VRGTAATRRMILLPIPHAWTPPHPPSSSRPLPKLFIVVGAADTVRRMASSGGGLRVTDEIPEVEMEVVEPEPEEPAPVGSKRIRDSPNGTGSRGKPPCSLSACTLYWFVCCFCSDCYAVGSIVVRLLRMLESCRRVVDGIVCRAITSNARIVQAGCRWDLWMDGESISCPGC